MNFVTDYIHEILIQVIIVQRDMYQNIRQIVVPLADALQISVHETTEDILKKFREHMRVGGPIEVATKNILLLHQWRSQIWGYDDNAHEAAMRLFDSPERKTGSLSNFSGSSGLARDDATSFNNMPLVDLTGSGKCLLYLVWLYQSGCKYLLIICAFKFSSSTSTTSDGC